MNTSKKRATKTVAKIVAPKIVASNVVAPTADTSPKIDTSNDVQTRRKLSQYQIEHMFDNSRAVFRASSKRAKIVKKWLVDNNNRITVDDVIDLTGWAKNACASELFQIATIFGRQIARNGANEYYFIENDE